MATNNLSNLLSTAKKTWSDTVETKKSTGIAELPDGKYIGQLTSTEVKQANTANAPFGVVSQYLILEGDLEGRVYTEWLHLFDADNTITSFVITRLEQLTETPAEDLDVTELETIFADAVEAEQVWQFTLKTTVSKKDGKEYQNIRLNKLMKDYESVTSAPDDEPEPPAKTKADTKKTPVKPAKTAPKKKVEAPCAIDDEVTFDLDGKEVTGTVISIEEDVEEVQVKVGIGKKAKLYALDYADVTVVEADDDDDDDDSPAYSEGDEITFNVTSGKGKTAKTVEHSGVVVSVDDDAEELEVLETVGKGKTAVKTEHTVAFSDVVPVEAADDDEANDDDNDDGTTDAPVEVGDDVTINYNGKEVTGKVTEVDEDSEEISVKVGKVVRIVAYDAIVTDEDDDDDDEADDEAGDPDEVDELKVGAKVEFTDPKTKKQLEGVVFSIDNEAETAKIKVGLKTFTVPGDEILILS